MSSQPIDESTVRKVAKLANLAVDDKEIPTMADHLSQILGYVDQLNSVDTSQVTPLDHVMDVVDAIRPDQMTKSLERSDALANAPKADGETFLVPPVLG